MSVATRCKLLVRVLLLLLLAVPMVLMFAVGFLASALAHAVSGGWRGFDRLL